MRAPHRPALRRTATVRLLGALHVFRARRSRHAISPIHQVTDRTLR
jgi:hypothetical protein